MTASRPGHRGLEVLRDPPGGSPEDLNVVLRVIERRAESPDCSSLLFERPSGLTYRAGDWVDLRFPTADLAVGRTFSYSSAPAEPNVRITFRHGRSPFKQRLEATGPGDILLITQHGSNGMLLAPRDPAVMIAGGVGVAPFRAMILDALEGSGQAPMSLILVNRAAAAPFRDDLDALAAATERLTVHHVTTSTSGRLDARRLIALTPAIADGRTRVYIAGPPAMVDGTEALVRRLGTRPDRIIVDSFTGY